MGEILCSFLLKIKEHSEEQLMFNGWILFILLLLIRVDDGGQRHEYLH